MTTNEEIRDRINEIRHNMDANCGRNHAYDYGQIRGLYFALVAQQNSDKTEHDIKVNIKYELDKAAYKQYVADMKEIGAKFREGNRTGKYVAGEELEYGDMVYKKPDGKLYKVGDNDTTKHIPATFEDVCRWWIDEYALDMTISRYTHIGQISKHMEHIMKDRGW